MRGCWHRCPPESSLQAALRSRLQTYLDSRLPAREQELLFQRGLALLSKDDMLHRQTRTPSVEEEEEEDQEDKDDDGKSCLGLEDGMSQVQRSLNIKNVIGPTMEGGENLIWKEIR